MPTPYSTHSSSLLGACLLLTVSCQPDAGSPPRPGPAPEPAAEAPPAREAPGYEQVVLVSIDTLRADHLGCYGYFRDTSPFLDGLAAEGTRFDHANVPVSYTAPSHASLFTGLWPLQHGVTRNGVELPDTMPTVAELFAFAGYRTGAVVSTAFLTRVARGFQAVTMQPDGAKATVADGLKWVRSLPPERPFFLWLHFFDVHESEEPDKRADAEFYAQVRDGDPSPAELYARLAALHGLPEPAPGEPLPRISWGKVGATRLGEQKYIHSREELIEGIDDYDANIARVDRALQQFVHRLGRLRPDRPTLFVITADHGEGLGSHRFRGHGVNVYQEQLRVPLILYATDGSVPVRVDGSLASLVDLAPTLAAVRTDDEWAPETEGVDLWPRILSGPDAAPDGRMMFIHRGPAVAGDEVFGVLTDRHKYLLHTERDDEFYDLAEDPLELRNRAEDAAAARYRTLLLRRLEEWRESAPETGSLELPPEIEAELRALGYIR